jgi:hypothetical protein
MVTMFRDGSCERMEFVPELQHGRNIFIFFPHYLVILIDRGKFFYIAWLVI